MLCSLLSKLQGFWLLPWRDCLPLNAPAFRWTHETDKQLPLLRGLIDQRVKEAQRLREQIQGMATSDDVPAKSRLLQEANEALDDVRRVGDLGVSAFFEREKPKDRHLLRTKYSADVQAWLGAAVGGGPAVMSGFSQTSTAAPLTFHWELEFPEVFTRATPGFDAFVGNPPFAGKNMITAAHSADYLQWLLELHGDSRGNSDLVAHFYRRAFNLLRSGGAFGLIATNTTAQGDTRGTGLRWIRHHDGTIFAARQRIKWPGEAAAVVVSVVHVHKGDLACPFDLDGRMVDRITAFLFHAGTDNDPKPLRDNEGKSFIGSYVLGMGFTFDDTGKEAVASPVSLMHDLIRKDPRNSERIFPYIGGEEVNDSPTHAHHRYVINFEQMTEQQASRWSDLIRIIEAKVRPERELLGDNPDGRRRRQFWWQWGRYTPALFETIRGLDRVLVTARVSQFWAPAFLASGLVYSEQLVVFSIDDYGSYALLQSRVHEHWFRFFGSSLEERPRYTPSDCFETFPFPKTWKSDDELERAGQDYYRFRAGLMVRRNEGLTKTYNRFHDPDERDPDIVKLRDLHTAMDRAVLDAYGWTDIQPACEFILDYEDDEDETDGQPSKKKKPWRYR